MAEDDVLSGGGGLEERAKHFQRVASVKRGGLGKRSEYRDVVGTDGTSCTEADFSEYHHRPQGSFGVIVSRRTVMDDEGEDLLVFAGFGKEPFA